MSFRRLLEGAHLAAVAVVILEDVEFAADAVSAFGHAVRSVIARQKGNDETMTMCQMMENFAKENYDLGKTDGYDLGKTEVICGLLRAQMDISLIAQVSSVDVEKIREIQRESEEAKGEGAN